ncbi:MAG: hypothetical protein AAGC44_10705 [Planctomycetota bacterium]
MRFHFRAILRNLLISVLLVLSCTAAAAQQVSHDSHRLEASYRFEETDDRGVKLGVAPHLMPPHWYPIGRQPLGASDKFRSIPLHESMEHRPGYPVHAAIHYDRQEKAKGDFSLFLGLVGGRTGAYLQSGAVPVTPGSDYQVTTSVKTRDLRFAWAELRAYFIDDQGNRIERSTVRSRPIRGEGGWLHGVNVKLRGDFPEAAFIGIELLILQQQRDASHPLGDYQIVPGDTRGGAWFDDIGVWELPRIELGTNNAVNVLVSPETPEIFASVRDLTGTRLTAYLTVYDIHQKPIAHESRTVGDGNSPSEWPWSPKLPGYGWYTTKLEVFDDADLTAGTQPIAQTLNVMLYLPEDPGDLGPDLGRFVLLAEDVADADLDLLTQLISQTGARGAVLSAWSRSSTTQSTIRRQQLMDTIVRDLTLSGGRVTLSFWPLPVELAAELGIDTHDPLAALSGDPGSWGPYTEPVFIRHGQRVRDWQVGSSRQPDAFFNGPLNDRLLAIEKRVGAMTPSPHIVVPWRLDQQRRPEVESERRSFAVAWPQGLTPVNLRGAVADWPVPPSDLRLDIELADAAEMSQPRRVTDLLLRMVHAWELGVGSLGLDTPWSAGQARRPSFYPDPVLGAWTQASRLLSGQNVLGRMPLGPGLHAMILDGRQGGMLVVWNDNTDAVSAPLSLYLGERPVAHDAFGNQTPLALSDGKHELVVSATPTFITGVDPRIALLRASFSLDDPFIESTQRAHPRTLRLANPFSVTMNGSLRITGPEGWAIQPVLHRFSIAPGRTIEVPLSIRFPIQEPGGLKALTAEVQFETDDKYELTLMAPIELGLRDVEFDATVVLEPGQTPGTLDAVVTLNATNRGDERIGLYLFTSLRDHPRNELLVPGIEPGALVSRRVRYTDIGDQIGKFPLRCGVQEMNGPAVLNHLLELRPPEIGEHNDAPVSRNE